MTFKLFFLLTLLLVNGSWATLFTSKNLSESEDFSLNSASSKSEVVEENWPSAVKIVDLDDLVEILSANKVDSKLKPKPQSSWSKLLDYFGLTHNDLSNLPEDSNEEKVAIFAIPDWNEAHMNNTVTTNRLFHGVLIPPKLKNMSNIFISTAKLLGQTSPSSKMNQEYPFDSSTKSTQELSNVGASVNLEVATDSPTVDTNFTIKDNKSEDVEIVEPSAMTKIVNIENVMERDWNNRETEKIDNSEALESILLLNSTANASFEGKSVHNITDSNEIDDVSKGSGNDLLTKIQSLSNFLLQDVSLESQFKSKEKDKKNDENEISKNESTTLFEVEKNVTFSKPSEIFRSLYPFSKSKYMAASKALRTKREEPIKQPSQAKNQDFRFLVNFFQRNNHDRRNLIDKRNNHD